MPNIKIFNIDTVPNIYIDQDALIGMSWSGDCKIAQQENGNLQYIYPKEGFPIWIDSFAILQNSKHLENAYKFINFMLRPEIAKQVTMTLGFTTANKSAIKLLPKEMQKDPIINPDIAIIKKGKIQLDPPNELRKVYEKYWEKLKIGN
jgi:spermidine/putrescine transport system substrate-binding protein